MADSFHDCRHVPLLLPANRKGYIYMEIDEIIVLAADLAPRLGLQMELPKTLYRKMIRCVPTTTILYNATNMLWIDRYYIAVNINNSLYVSYIYLTKHHIREELPGIIRLRDSAAIYNDLLLYSDMAEQMLEARKVMRITGKSYYLSPDYENYKGAKDMERQIKRGDIYCADLDPVAGSEQGGRRPVLVVQSDIGNEHSPTLVVVPITGKLGKNPLPTHAPVPASIGLEKESLALAEQVRTIDRSRLLEYIGHMDKSALSAIDRALAISVGLSHERPKPLILSLCRRCEADFRNSGYILVKRGWQEVKETCDFCNTRKGLNFGIFSK